MLIVVALTGEHAAVDINSVYSFGRQLRCILDKPQRRFECVAHAQPPPPPQAEFISSTRYVIPSACGPPATQAASRSGPLSAAVVNRKPDAAVLGPA